MKKKILLPAILFMLMLFVMPVSAQGKASTSTMNLNQKYYFDYTGDGKIDTVELVATKYDKWTYTGIKIVVNNTPVYEKNSYFFENYSKKVQLANGKSYIALVLPGEDGDSEGCGIFGYKNGKCQKLVDFAKHYKFGYHVSIQKISASNNTITVKYSDMTYTMASIQVSVPYKYKAGSLVQSKTKLKFKTYIKRKYWTTNKKIALYKSVGSKKKIATIQKNAKVKIDKIYVNQKCSVVYFHVKVKGGRSGWIKAAKKYQRTTMFKDTPFAG